MSINRVAAPALVGALSALLVAAAPQASAVPSPAPDVTFAAGGVATASFGGVDQPGDVALAPDGRIVVAGASTTADGVTRVAVARLLPSGQLDPTFAGDGTVVTAVDGSAAAAVAVQRDGKVVVGTRGGALLRYTVSGALDRSFSGDGVVPDADASADVLVRPDGRIATLGLVVNLFTAAGLPVGGPVDVNGGGAGFRLLAAQSTGHLVIAGASDCNTAPVARLDPALAGTQAFFGGPGVGVAAVGLSVLPGDKVLEVSSGRTEEGCGSSPAITFERYLADGTRDSTFGTDGAVVVDTLAWPAGLAGVAPVSAASAPGGRIVVLGSTYLARFTAAGAPDATFSGDGVLPLAAGTATELAVQPDTHSVLAGAAGGHVVVRRYLGGPTVTAYPDSVAVVTGWGRVTGGSRASLAAVDGNTYRVSSTTTGTRRAAWTANVDRVPNSLSRLRVSVRGSATAARTQALAVWDVRRAVWVTVNTRQLPVSTSVAYEVSVPGTLGDYVTGTSGTGRVRVRVSATSSSSFSSATDRLALSFR